MTKPVVLIVECEALIRISAVHIVEDAGFSVLEACNADDAIRLLESRSEIRAVLTGVNMPGSMDGLKLAHAIRGRWPPVHLIVTSGLDVRDRLPINSRFIRKPYSAEHIRIALSELFGSHPAPRRLFNGAEGNRAKVA
jgi:CheY-like chemotaxis protein